MSAELIGILATAIALGTVLFAAIRGIRQDLRRVEDSLRADIAGLRGDMTAGDKAIREEMLAGHNALRDEIQAGYNALRRDMTAGDKAVREEMQAGFKEFGARLSVIGDRLSKLEGVIEGLFWSARNQPPDKSRTGAA